MRADETRQHIREIKYGGIKYVNNVPLEQINQFVEELPADKRSSMAEVTMLLKDQGLISLIDDGETSPPCPE